MFLRNVFTFGPKQNSDIAESNQIFPSLCSKASQESKSKHIFKSQYLKTKKKLVLLWHNQPLRFTPHANPSQADDYANSDRNHTNGNEPFIYVFVQIAEINLNLKPMPGWSTDIIFSFVQTQRLN
jgi:hypothetical protein